MATTLQLPPQRATLVELVLPTGQRFSLLMSMEWYRGLEASLAAAAAAAGGGNATTDDDSLEPIPLAYSGDDQADDEGAPPGADPVLLGLFLGAVERLQALEGETGLQQLQAQVAALQERLDQLEEELTP